MKLATFRADGAERIGAIIGDALVPLHPALSAAQRAAGEADSAARVLPADMVGLLAAGEAALVAAARALAFAARPENAALRRPLASVELLAVQIKDPNANTFAAMGVYLP